MGERLNRCRESVEYRNVQNCASPEPAGSAPIGAGEAAPRPPLLGVSVDGDAPAYCEGLGITTWLTPAGAIDALPGPPPASTGLALAAADMLAAQAMIGQLQSAGLEGAVRVVLLAAGGVHETMATVRSLQKALDNIPAPIFSKDRRGVYRACNKAFEAYVGLPRDMIIGRTVSDLAPEELAATYAAADNALFASGGCQVYDARVRYADGSIHDVTYYKGVHTDDEGAIQGLSGAMLDVTERRALETQLEALAHTDTLTGLGNRAAFSQRLETAATDGARDDRHPAVLLIDLDDFKNVNDTMGHEAGDHLLVKVGQLLRDSVRPGDTVARLGGDEFAILLEDIRARDIPALVHRIFDGLAQPLVLGNHRLIAEASVGVAYGGQGRNGSDILRNADMAMYAAKEQGRGRWVLYQDGLQTRVLDRAVLLDGLRRAIERREIFLEYQPIVVLPSRTMVGVEALARWQHPDHGVIPPSEFVPLAETSGLIVPLGDLILRQACHQAAAWAGPERTPPFITVNTSARQLREAGFVSGLRAALDSSGLFPPSLVLEVTETDASDDIALARTLHAVRALGVRVALDDFGTGRSSLSRLATCPADILKIDRSCVERVAVDNRHAAIASGIHQLAGMLGLDVIAEGVETAEQVVRLSQLGYRYLQGFYFAAPGSADSIRGALASGLPLSPVQDDRDRPPASS